MCTKKTMPATLQACLEPTRHAPNKVCACHLGRKNTYSYFPICQCMTQPAHDSSLCHCIIVGEYLCMTELPCDNICCLTVLTYNMKGYKQCIPMVAYMKRYLQSRCLKKILTKGKTRNQKTKLNTHVIPVISCHVQQIQAGLSRAMLEISSEFSRLISPLRLSYI